MQELIKALIKAKGEFKAIAKDKTNPHYKSKYSSLDTVLAAVEPALAKNGLVLTHQATNGEFITTLHHESGESLSSSLPLPTFADPQKMGSYLSYCRRYAITGLLSVCSDEDDDANANIPAKGSTPAPAKGNTPAASKAPTDQFALLRRNVTGAFKQLGWEKDQIKEWIDINFGGRPSEKWDTNDWQKASRELSTLVDQDVATNQ
jgi:hypothetical protein